jgi:hypothetical protein
MNTHQIAEDALLEMSRLQRETLERWALICATAGETQIAEELRSEINEANELKEAA